MPHIHYDPYNPNTASRWCAALLLIGLLAVILTSCGAARPVITERVKTEYRDRLLSVRDSVYLKDSVIIRLRGDTVYRDRRRTKYRYLTVHDTAYVLRTDSVPVPYRVEVPARLTWWQRVKVRIGGAALCLVLAFGIWFVRFKR